MLCKVHVCVCVSVCLFSCQVVFDSFATPMDCSLPGSSVHGFPSRNTAAGCHFLLQGIFLTQGSNMHLLRCRRILY